MRSRRLAIHEIVVSIDLVPRCSRRLRVSSGASLARLNHVLCTAFQWPSDKPYVFVTTHLRHEGRWSASRAEEVDDVRLRQVLPDRGATLTWECGAGGKWSATIELIAVHTPNEQIITPSCVSAKGAPPQFDADPWEPPPPDSKAEASHTGGPATDTRLLDVINAALAALRR